MTEPVEHLAAHAHDTTVVVVGGGIAGLVAALECAKVGLRVTLVEAADALGGTIRAADLDGTRLDIGADSWATAGGAVDRLVDDLGLGDAVEAEASRDVWVGGITTSAAPLPRESVIGIPANPWDPAVRRIIGWRGTWRAYLDRLRPPLTIGQQRDLDKLVRGRMGDRVVDRLVAPLTIGRHGLLPSDVDVEYAAPGLSTALTRTGSLAGGVSQVLGERAASAGNATLRGGLAQLVDAIRQRLSELDARVLTATPVTGLARAAAGWVVETPEEQLRADHVVVATHESAAHDLLGQHVSLPPQAAPRTLSVVTLLVDAPSLDTHPRGSAVYPGSADVTAVVLPCARWPWLAQDLGPSTHVVRVQSSGDASGGDARAAASALLGVELSVRASHEERFVLAAPPSASGQVARGRAVRAAVHAVEGLAVAGAWVAGSGLANVVPDALEAAERVRRRALFGSSTTE